MMDFAAKTFCSFLEALQFFKMIPILVEPFLNLQVHSKQVVHQSKTFKCARSRCLTCPSIPKVDKISGLKRSIKISDHFT